VGSDFAYRSPYRLGPNRHCWRNVEKLVADHGGELVMGFGIVRDLEMRFAQKNDFARVALNSHAVWCSDGDYFETTKERQGKEFLIATAPRCNCTIEFFDYDSKKTLEELDEILPIASHEGIPYRNLFVSLRSQKLLGEQSPD
jgi:hypothetical protein